MTLQEKTDQAIDEYNAIVDQQTALKEQFDELEQQRLVLFGQVQTLSELLSQEKEESPEDKEEEKPKPAPKSSKAAK